VATTQQPRAGFNHAPLRLVAGMDSATTPN
jgi:hypothetical protein